MRTVLAVVVGYLVIMALAVPIFGLVYAAPELVFVEGEARATIVFSLATMAVGFAAAFVGGFVALKIAGGRGQAAVTLALLVLVLGLAMAFANLFGEPPPDKTPEEVAQMSVAERVEHSREPLWYSFSTPVVGALGVLLGGRRRAGG